jgi:hypothetical protein
MEDIKNNRRVTNGLMQENKKTNFIRTLDFKTLGAIFIGTVLFALIVIAMTTEWLS